MSYKISNYAIVCKALQIFCKRMNCDFLDLPVVFCEIKDPNFSNGSINVSKNGSLTDTMASIFCVYVNCLPQICGRNIDNINERETIIKFFLALLRDFKVQYGKSHEHKQEDVISLKLDQFPVVWVLLKNIFCPYKNIKLKNLDVIAKHSHEFDAAISIEKEDETYLFANLDIEKSSVRSAFLLVESLRAMLDKKDSPEALIREIFSNFFMRDRLVDFLGIAFVEDSDVANFLAVLSILCQSKDIEDLALSLSKKENVKTAQANPYVGNWWFLGLTERMLDSVRGPDWSTTKALKDFSKDLWDKVEEERKARGLSELPFELLLRVQSKDLKTEENVTMQDLLSKVRIW